MSRNDAAKKWRTPRFLPPPESQPGSRVAVFPDSRQHAPGSFAQVFEFKHALHALSGRRKLPRRVMLDAVIFANLCLLARITLHPALDIRSKFKRSAELFFLILTVRAPPRAIHLHAAIFQTLRERVMLVLIAVAQIVRPTKRSYDQHSINCPAPPIDLRWCRPIFLLFPPLSSQLRHDFLYHDPQRRRQHIDRFALHRERLAVHHHVNRSTEIELNSRDFLALRHRMPHMRSVIQTAQIPNQTGASYRPPAHEINHPIIGRSRRRNHHRSARKFAVVKTEKQARPPIVLTLALHSNRKRPPFQLRQPQKNRDPVSQLPRTFESSLPQNINVRRKANTQQIDVMQNAFPM